MIPWYLVTLGVVSGKLQSYRDVSPSIIPPFDRYFRLPSFSYPSMLVTPHKCRAIDNSVVLSKMGQVGLGNPSPHSCRELVIGHATHHLRDASCTTRGILPRSRYAIECRLPDRSLLRPPPYCIAVLSHADRKPCHLRPAHGRAQVLVEPTCICLHLGPQRS